MQDKHKVTLYLPPELHRQLKIRSAVELEPMSTLAERAIVFYLQHSELVDEVETSHGHVHRIYNCPECTSTLVLKQGEMVPITDKPGIIADEAISAGNVSESSDPEQKGEELVPLLG
jgi:hypothetical protein